MKNLHVINILRNADFRNLWLSQLISQTFLNVLIFSQLLRVYELTRSNIAVAILVLTIGIPNLFFGALAGVLVDRWDKKVVMFFAQFIRVFAIIAFIISSESVAWIYTLMFIISCVTQFWAPAEVSTIPQIIKGPKLLTANSVFTLTFFTTVIIGNILAGPILANLGAHNTYYVISAAFLLATAFVIRLPGPSLKELIYSWTTQLNKSDFERLFNRQLLNEIRQEFRVGIDFIKNNKKIARAIFFLGASQTLIASLSAIAPGFADKIIGIKTTDTSLLVMLPAALGMVLGALVVGQFFIKANRQLLIGTGILVCAFSLLIFSQVSLIAKYILISKVILSFVILLGLGVGNAFLDIPANTILQENTTEKIRSRIYGVLTAFVGAASVLPIILAGVLSDIVGVDRVVFGLGLLVLAFALYNRD